MYATNCLKLFCCRKTKNYCGSLNSPQNLKLLPIDTKSALSYARILGIHIWLTEDKYAQILRTVWFTDLYISTVFSSSFSSTPIAEEDEKNLRAGSRVPGMSSKNRFVFLWFFFIMKHLQVILMFLRFFDKLENRKIAWLIKRHVILGKQYRLLWHRRYHETVSSTDAFTALKKLVFKKYAARAGGKAARLASVPWLKRVSPTCLRIFVTAYRHPRTNFTHLPFNIHIYLLHQKNSTSNDPQLLVIKANPC